MGGGKSDLEHGRRLGGGAPLKGLFYSTVLKNFVLDDGARVDATVEFAEGEGLRIIRLWSPKRKALRMVVSPGDSRKILEAAEEVIFRFIGAEALYKKEA